jgi:hypothetical protein
MPLQGNWWLCRNIGCPDRQAKIADLGDETFVLQWLRGFRADTSKMLKMRSVLAAEFGSTELLGMSDQEVLAKIARFLISGKCHIHQSIEHSQIPPEGAITNPARSAPVPRSGRSFTAVAPFREPPVDPPTFLADIDIPVQAATLMAAASSGKPFCPE